MSAATRYRLTRTIKARFDGTCAIDTDHSFAKGTQIGLCVLAGNPLKDLFGYACPRCVTALKED